MGKKGPLPGEMNILHLIKQYKGNYPLFNEYVRALSGAEYHSVVCYISGRPDGKNAIENIASEVRYLNVEAGSLKSISPRIIRAVYRLLRDDEIDVVHCHRHRATVIGVIASLLARTPRVISQVHGLSRTRSKKRYITNRLILRRVDRIVAVSDGVRDDIIRSNPWLDPGHVVTIRNGIDLAVIDNVTCSREEARERLGIPADALLFGTVGRLSPTKGQSFLIDAFAQVCRSIPQAMLVLIGDGPLAESLKKQAAQTPVAQKIIFTGYRTDVRDLLRGVDLFVLPSVAEGLSIALLEAMASGLPVIASRVGGIPEVFGDRDCGILVNKKNTDELAGAMRTLALRDQGETLRLGRNARSRIEQSFTAEIMRNNLLRLYDSLREQI